ncbi:hypothetical protein Scep_001776 [Stephania cephalantha]|uniref:Uncharacterized protein n=1 Tax=Stephania cephalantha TaxID=152367 RepID=A0AAP0Q430_9MAGN
MYSQLVDEYVGTSNTRSMMERLHMQSPQSDVVQDGFGSPVHDDINADSDDEVNDDDNNETDEDVRVGVCAQCQFCKRCLTIISICMFLL